MLSIKLCYKAKNYKFTFIFNPSPILVILLFWRYTDLKFSKISKFSILGPTPKNPSLIVFKLIIFSALINKWIKDYYYYLTYYEYELEEEDYDI